MKALCCVFVLILFAGALPVWAQEPTPTETPVPPTDTATPTSEATMTETPIVTPGVFVYSTLSSGQVVVTEFRVTPGEQIIVGMLFFVAVLLIVLLFVVAVKSK